jgi:hypothetical protein
MTEKDGRRQSLPHFTYFPGIFVDRLREITKNLYIPSSVQDWKPNFPHTKQQY